MSTKSGSPNREVGRSPLTGSDRTQDGMLEEQQVELALGEGSHSSTIDVEQMALFPDEPAGWKELDSPLVEPEIWEAEFDPERAADDQFIDPVFPDDLFTRDDPWEPDRNEPDVDLNWIDLDWNELIEGTEAFLGNTTHFPANPDGVTDFFDLEAEKQFLRTADPPLVGAKQQEWVGPESLYPPFTVGEFQSALGGLRDIGTGWSGARHGAIAGQHYAVKLISGTHTMPAGGFMKQGQYFAEVAHPIRYEASAEQAAYDIARVLGQADQTVPVYAFEYHDRQFVVSPYVDNLEPIYAVLHRRTIANEPDVEDLIEQLAHHIVRDYVLGDEDRNGTNFAVNPQTRRIVGLDYARCLRYEGTNLLQSAAVDLCIAAVGNPSATPLPRHAIEPAVRGDQAILQTIRTHHLEPGILGAQRRLRTLRLLLEKQGEVTLQDLGIVRHFTGWRAENEQL